MQQPCAHCGRITNWKLASESAREEEFPNLGPLSENFGLAECGDCGTSGLFVVEADDHRIVFMDPSPESPAELGIDEHQADPDVYQLYSESLEAEKRGHNRLAIMGYRGVLDLCFNRLFGHDIGTLAGKLEAHLRSSVDFQGDSIGLFVQLEHR